MAQGTPAPFVKPQYFTNNGLPAAGYKLFFFASGTTTPATTYSNAGLTVANAHPIVLDSSGRASIFLESGLSYKLSMALPTDVSPPASPIWTVDGVQAVPPAGTEGPNDASVVAGEAISINDACYISDGSGGLTAGRAYRTDSDQTYSSTLAGQIGIAPAAISTGATGTIRLSGSITGLTGRTAGALQYISATAGDLTETAPANARLIAVADSTTSVIVGPWAGTISAGATSPGILTSGTQSIGGTKSFMDPPKYAPGTAVTAAATVSGVVFSSITPVGNVGGGTDNLIQTTLEGNTLSANGKAIRVTAWGTTAANANNKTISFLYGVDTIPVLAASALNNIDWSVVITFVRVSSSVERAFATFSAVGFFGVQITADWTRNTTIDQALGFTGVGTATDDIVQLGMIVEVVG